MTLSFRDCYKAVASKWLEQIPSRRTFSPIGCRYDVDLSMMLDEKRVTGASLGAYSRSLDVRWDRIDLEDVNSKDFPGEDLERYALEVGDILVCEGGEIGRAAIWDGRLKSFFYQQALHRLHLHTPIKDHPPFLVYLPRSSCNLSIFEASQTEATIPHLTAKALRRCRMPFPYLSEERDIVSFSTTRSGRSTRWWPSRSDWSCF